MARIRTIKPEFWTSTQVVECSTSARLLFIGLWTFADDGGVQKANPLAAKMRVFPGDSFTVDDIRGWIGELITAGLIVEYEAQGVSYWHITGFQEHQKIDRPTCKYPQPLDEPSSTARRALVEPSSSPHPRKGMEGKGREGNVKEGRESARATAVPFGSEDVLPAGESMATEVVAACDRWLEFLGATADRRVSADTVRSQLLEFRRQGREWSELPQVVAACIQGDKRQLFWDADRGPPRRGRSKPNDGIVF